MEEAEHTVWATHALKRVITIESNRDRRARNRDRRGNNSAVGAVGKESEYALTATLRSEGAAT